MVCLEAQPRRADQELRRRVINFLSCKHFPGLRSLKVDAQLGVVTISGRVSTFHERQLCINCCRRVAGVVRLDDRVVVSPPNSTSRSGVKNAPLVSSNCPGLEP
ncbi:MAG: BON domain-containing protein [Pirellulales bacterium]|nr:BON domain-containing protein [Pirellulales bacterium]